MLLVLLNSWLSSVPLWLGLGLVFFIGLVYYWLQLKNSSISVLVVIQAVLRGLFLLGLILCFVPWKISVQEPQHLPRRMLFIVDDSQSMNLSNFKSFINEAYDKIKKLNSGELELKLISLNQRVNELGDILPNGKFSSWAQVQEIIRKESKDVDVTHVFFATDAQLSHLDSPNPLGRTIYVIPFGKEVIGQKLGLLVPSKPLISVLNEPIHVPISVWSNGQVNRKTPSINVLLNGQLFRELKVEFDRNVDFKQVDLEMVGKRQGKFEVSIHWSESPNDSQTFTWIVQEFKANIEAYAIAPNPSIGVINRIAKEAHMNVHWNFTQQVNSLAPADNYLFYGILPKELPKDKSIWILNVLPENLKQIPQMEEMSSIGEHFPSVWKKWVAQRTSLSANSLELWKEQMAEMKAKGNHQYIDSAINELFKISFLRKADDLFSLELNQTSFLLGEEVVFELRQLEQENLQLKGLQLNVEIKGGGTTTRFNRKITQAHQVESFIPSRPGNYQYIATLQGANKVVEFKGKFTVQDLNLESVKGRNSVNLQLLASKDGVKVVELAGLSSISFNDTINTDKGKLKEINLWEWPYFGLVMLMILAVEWIIRKSLHQI
ncbi:hypothetical protein ESB04_00525 [Aquirufa rosea]|uniref:VWA domain-containing protein n=2 Tax=Aquirufa rosea TaxID=2509241 RepID=A0A4Q1C1U3_9BACT|nr:hypothetical protein ESB04_00525 [Aquirufa rosea]